MTLVQDTRPGPLATRAWPRPAHVVRLVLVLGWVVLAGLVAVVGSRESSFADLERAVRAGDVDAVVVEGGLAPEGRGFATVRVTWRDGPIADSTLVREMRPVRRAPRASDVSAVVEGSVADRLRSLDPDLRVRTEPRSSETTIGEGWHVPGWLSMPTMLMFVATLLFVVASPPPVHCTRWAGFWLFASGPVGLAAYLALVGPLRRLGGRWRVTGCWGFVAFLLLSTVIGW